jgi:GntR family transcriptional repressor for pyruvate dehydrogenase complex
LETSLGRYDLAEPLFQKISAPPAYRIVYDKIEQQIMDGRLRLGDILPSETELAVQFGVNRSTVREGIRLLEESGLVFRKSAKRLKISAPPLGDLASRASRALKLSQITFLELWEVALTVEPMTARLASERATEEEIDLLTKNLEEMELRIEDPEAVVLLDIEFHNLLAQAARNRALALAREPVSLLFLPAGRAILPRLHTEKRIVDAHRLILSMITDRQPAIAETWMRKHIEDFRRGFERTGLDATKPLDSFRHRAALLDEEP